jgi:hypothetical protein
LEGGKCIAQSNTDLNIALEITSQEASHTGIPATKRINRLDLVASVAIDVILGKGERRQ